jgi:hypothetical protein
MPPKKTESHEKLKRLFTSHPVQGKSPRVFFFLVARGLERSGRTRPTFHKPYTLAGRQTPQNWAHRDHKTKNARHAFLFVLFSGFSHFFFSSIFSKLTPHSLSVCFICRCRNRCTRSGSLAFLCLVCRRALSLRGHTHTHSLMSFSFFFFFFLSLCVPHNTQSLSLSLSSQTNKNKQHREEVFFCSLSFSFSLSLSPEHSLSLSLKHFLSLLLLPLTSFDFFFPAGVQEKPQGSPSAIVLPASPDLPVCFRDSLVRCCWSRNVYRGSDHQDGQLLGLRCRWITRQGRF